MPRSTENKVFHVIAYFSNGQSIVEAQRAFSREYGRNEDASKCAHQISTAWNSIEQINTGCIVKNEALH